MLTVTESAKQTLVKMLDDANAPDTKAARFVAQGDQMSLTLDEPKDEDTKFEQDGRTLLVISPQVGELLDGQQLDLVETAQGSGLGIKPQEA